MRRLWCAHAGKGAAGAAAVLALRGLLYSAYSVPINGRLRRVPCALHAYGTAAAGSAANQLGMPSERTAPSGRPCRGSAPSPRAVRPVGRRLRSLRPSRRAAASSPPASPPARPSAPDRHYRLVPPLPLCVRACARVCVRASVRAHACGAAVGARASRLRVARSVGAAEGPGGIGRFSEDL